MGTSGSTVEESTQKELRSICKAANIDFDLFIRACRMLSEYELNKVKLSVVQVYLYKQTGVSSVHINRKATKRYVEQINAAAKLSFTFNQSINKLKEQLKDE